MFILGLALLTFGADLLVRGASRLATAFGISPQQPDSLPLFSQVMAGFVLPLTVLTLALLALRAARAPRAGAAA